MLSGRILPLVFVCISTLGKAQLKTSFDSLWMLPDSVQPFTMEAYFSLILKNHPVARQANLLPEIARQEIRMALGNFDPKLEAGFDTKRYDDKLYYSIASGSLKIPTRSPITAILGADRNTGTYLNPEHYIGDEFNYIQYKAGLSIPLGQGLLTDERRTALKQAFLFQEMNQAEQVKIINKVLLEAAKHYWDWHYAFHSYRLITRNVTIASDIYELVRMNHHQGEASAVDTIQAVITLQQRRLEQQEAWLNLQNSRITLANALWDSTGNPMMPDAHWAPVFDVVQDVPSKAQLEELISQAKENHPELRKIDVKLRQLETEKRLAKEYLKPNLHINYYALNQPVNPEGELFGDVTGSYKFGLGFSMPIFLRKERSKLSLINLKLSHAALEQISRQRAVLNELEIAYNRLVTQYAVIEMQFAMMQNYERLLQAEVLNLTQGESDLFKINIQQEKLLQTQTKWLKLVAEFEKQMAYLYWAAGSSPQIATVIE